MNESKNHEWQLCLAFDCFLLLSHTLLLNRANILHFFHSSIAKEQGETEYIPSYSAQCLHSLDTIISKVALLIIVIEFQNWKLLYPNYGGTEVCIQFHLVL